MFQRICFTEEKCAEALAELRWPGGFKCPSCGCSKHCRLERRELRQCAECSHQTSTAAGTLFEHAKLPFSTGFQVIFLITRGKKGVSAMDPARKTGAACSAAWRMKHKIMQATVEREDEKPLEGLIKVDDVYLGGVARAGGTGARSENSVRRRAGNDGRVAPAQDYAPGGGRMHSHSCDRGRRQGLGASEGVRLAQYRCRQRRDCALEHPAAP